MADNKSLPLVVRKGFRDHEADRVKNLEKIKSITGAEWTFEVEPELVEFHKAVAKDNLAETLYVSYLTAVSTL